MASQASSAAEDAGAGGDPERLDPALIRLALIVLAGTVVVQLDATIVSVALETLGRSFHAGVATIQWVSTAYLLALAVVIPLTGWLVDRFGGRRMWLIALALFLAGSALCGAAWSAGSLIAFRIVQGLGGGLLLPLMQTILAQAAGPRRLGRLMATVAVPALLTPVLGPVVGGVLVDSLSWRWIFLINVPVCVIAFALAWRWMPPLPGAGHQAFDGLGFALLSPGLAAVVYGFSEAGRRGDFADPRGLVPLVVGVLLLVAFAVHALRMRGVPLIDLRLFRSAPFSGSAGLMFLFGISLYGAMFLLPLYEQQVRGRGATDAGLLLAPQGLGMMIAMILLGRVVDRTSPRLLVLIGLSLAILGSVAYTQIGTDTSELLLGASLVVRGMGLAAATIPVMSAAYTGLASAQIPRATSAVRIFQQIGGSLGTAVLAVVLAHELRGAGSPNPATQAHAFAVSFWWTLGATVVALPCALLLPGRVVLDDGPQAAETGKPVDATPDDVASAVAEPSVSLPGQEAAPSAEPGSHAARSG
ncbi:Drug resistance transporter, EmrB/QacA subfamily [Frankia canadensis]|uniref:Drug resistance transporter, EmrB/QacA subfamily n=1 Tax=Frankia canadensis TaxID=1836972 RepID=A0A2I2KMH6_9ACTN|nr:MDR family MFS transporter [Frankia canadensis]SNQ46868.1 Drug resistance transporter, EmrB/QacA subfamily [Frankia canadensis]SOU54158.1 Drug resistance transporter, EmrB/QacA subfamily [Frankia canadensis]